MTNELSYCGREGFVAGLGSRDTISMDSSYVDLMLDRFMSCIYMNLKCPILMKFNAKIIRNVWAKRGFWILNYCVFLQNLNDIRSNNDIQTSLYIPSRST